ncbi:p-loop containing nucleoside triphosphate hydrolase [Colletotrichum incanum]|uniref:p-loop containing nucleoside triphosphate hydrolase n=1 Tax=Colletotrichum incanum TaxID=1573173 RepID=A0A161VHX2_COLIC|nr:p-loop containing nucleoside triphosphate hydrolase [Colletotrichum incanum]
MAVQKVADTAPQLTVDAIGDKGAPTGTEIETSDSSFNEVIDTQEQEMKTEIPEDAATDHGNSEDVRETKKAWIGYRLEYRNRWTGDLISERTYEKGNEPRDQETGGPIFEMITSYRVSTHSLDPESAVPITSQALPTRHICIHSIAIINALQSVVRYYPGQDFSGESIVVQKPYPVLVHYYDELQQFRLDCLAKFPNELCDREKDAADHLGILLGFLDEEVMPDVRQEQERNKRGFATFEWRWVAYKPGITVLDRTNTGDWQASVVHSISGGVFENPAKDWEVKLWCMDYDGENIERIWSSPVTWSKFDGERSDSKAGQETKFFDPTLDESFLDDEITIELVENGKKFCAMVKKQCFHHKGKGACFPFNDIEGLAMVDLDSYYTMCPDDTPLSMGTDDLRNWSTECTCEICQTQKQHLDRKIAPLFSTFGQKGIETGLTNHESLLCPSTVVTYVFRTRTWEYVHIKNLHPPRFDENMISHLVMSEQRLKTLKALSKSYARVNKHGEGMKDSKWSADFVRGKGNGLIFLLHGKPGVGKTCTAECIAEFTRRPLMILTSSDVGTDPKQVEHNLTSNFKRAMSWGAVLLIDEADVFMERRTTSDLTRNSLVAGFLRALEFYDGILFLTTNRVGSFDDAFISRIHVQLYYPDFTDDERQQVWKTFIDKLGRERGDTMRMTIDAKEYIASTRKQGIKWNGREIRNAFQTAVALAEYDAEKDSEGRIMVTDNHLRAVVELSKDFKGYLNNLHRRDEEKRAEDRYERLVAYDEDK